MVLAPDVRVTVAGKVTVPNVPDTGPATSTLPAPQSAVAEHVAPPTNVIAAVLVLDPMMVGVAVVGAVADSAAGKVKVTLPAAPDGIIVPNRNSAGWESVSGGTTVVVVPTLVVSATAGRTPKPHVTVRSVKASRAPVTSRAVFGCCATYFPTLCPQIGL
jgi:hypothetical protein